MKNAQDAMNRLAAARPARLDPAPDPERRRRDLAGALAESAERRTLRLWLRRRWMIGSGLLAAATATAVAIAAIGGDPLSGRPSATKTTSLSAQSVLLSAAESMQGAAGQGPYWLTDEVQAWATVIRAPSGPYVLENRQDLRQWIGTGGHPSWQATRGLGAHPQRAGDVGAWRRAGSPTRWTNPSWTTQPSRWKTEKVPDGVSLPDGSAAQARRLPTDPARLREYFLKQRHSPEGSLTDAEWLYDSVWDLFSEPAPAGVRAAAYRMLAQVPGIRSLGSMTDPLGRRGQAVVLPNRAPAGGPATERRLIVDTATGRLLAEQTILVRARPGGPVSDPGAPLDQVAPAGTILEYRAYRQTIWVATAP